MLCLCLDDSRHQLAGRSGGGNGLLSTPRALPIGTAAAVGCRCCHAINSMGATLAACT
jgi:hypothetical protein